MLLIAQLDPQQIFSIEVLKGADAVLRFGPGAQEGGVLIRISPPDSSRKNPTKPKPANP